MTTSLPFISIKAKARHHSLFLILLALALFVFTFIISQFYWRSHRLHLIFIYLITIVILFTGLLKRSEPSNSFQITPKGIWHYHRHGSWRLTWQQIQTINSIREVIGITTIALPYIGIKLKNIEVLADQISPRLANRLIHEQRPIVAFAIKQQLLSFEEAQLNFTPFVLTSGGVIKGPLAAFLHHSKMLHNAMGYHLYIDEPSTDRELDDFCLLLKQCQRYCNNYQ